MLTALLTPANSGPFPATSQLVSRLEQNRGLTGAERYHKPSLSDMGMGEGFWDGKMAGQFSNTVKIKGSGRMDRDP